MMTRDRMLTAIGAAILLGSAFAAEEKASPTPEELFAKGREALFQGEFDRAIELLGAAVGADGTKTSYRLHLARAYRYAGKLDAAAARLGEILAMAPDHVEAGQNLAEIHASAGRWKEVVAVLEPLLTYRHDYPLYHLLAEASYNLNLQAKARSYYEEAIKLNPESGPDHYQLGNIYLAGNLFALAAQAFQAALARGIDDPVLRYKLGSAYFNLRNYFGRIAVRQIPSGAPETIDGEWYTIEPVPGRRDLFRCAPSASAIYQIAKALAGGLEARPDIHLMRAAIYLNAQRYGQAYDIFATTAAQVPPESKALFSYYHAQAAFGLGKYDEYLTLLEEAIRLDPEAYRSNLVDAYVKVADHFNQAGNIAAYIEYLAKAVAESPQTASLHLKLGDAYEEMEKPSQAIAQWRMALDLEPDHPRRTKLLNLIARYESGSAPAAAPTPESAAGARTQ